MNKKERRIAVLVEGKEISAICVFRGQFLEHLFLGKSKEEVLSQFNNSSVSKEITSTSASNDLEEICRFIVEKISQKINKVNS
ncbi:DNA-directed RNA polymerase subunit M [Acidianus ambivalens]|uniref:DNA-directed RNA polymerase subunit M n=1 Tax=Acidianus ambivalens TaxID=2283 RepID=A0A650CSI7_ACIAM|nr:DNA-directed RNA polymerase subunit M [Acidianus ambivalens]MQL55221.1 DNA-directed RNA polymerase subunit M [Acidianus ambivalens]QGR20766.1 DNA-directed RNA polymerase subunit M [Acidianus ambivalens]